MRPDLQYVGDILIWLTSRWGARHSASVSIYLDGPAIALPADFFDKGALLICLIAPRRGAIKWLYGSGYHPICNVIHQNTRLLVVLQIHWQYPTEIISAKTWVILPISQPLLIPVSLHISQSYHIFPKLASFFVSPGKGVKIMRISEGVEVWLEYHKSNSK